MTERPAGPITVVGAHVGGLLMQVDAVPREGETVLGHSFEEPEDGGKATNQAVAAARLGAPTRVLTLLGDDERGDRWLAALARYGVDTRFVLRAAGPTDVGVVLLPPSRVPAIVSSIALSAELDGAAVASAAGALADASVVLCQLEAPPSCALAAFALAREAGARTVLNPAPAVPLDPALLALTDVLVPNEHEAAVLAGVDEPPAALASALARRAPGDRRDRDRRQRGLLPRRARRRPSSTCRHPRSTSSTRPAPATPSWLRSRYACVPGTRSARRRSSRSARQRCR